jgi:hypothetical protein
MEKANTLAYYDKATITAVKKFIVQAQTSFLFIMQSTKMETFLKKTNLILEPIF